MKTSNIKQTICDNKMQLYEAAAILKLIGQSEAFSDPATAYTAAAAVFRIVDKVSNGLDRLETDIGRKAVQDKSYLRCRGCPTDGTGSLGDTVYAPKATEACSAHG